MGFARIVEQIRQYFVRCAASTAVVFCLASPSFSQTKPAGQQPEMQWTKDLNKYPGLLPELSKLIEKLQQNIQFPAPRAESRLLPLLPASTMSYAAFPNYGDVTEQALKIFRQELQDSAALREWWGHGNLATTGPKFEDAVEKFYQFEQYLGEEIVVSGAMENLEPRVLVVAEIRKPGLKKFLEKLLSQAARWFQDGHTRFGPAGSGQRKGRGPVTEPLCAGEAGFRRRDVPTDHVAQIQCPARPRQPGVCFYALWAARRKGVYRRRVRPSGR